MNIQVTDLDTAYTTCENLNNLAATKGEEIISTLGTTVNNLKNHWIGTDANTHIANLIKVYNALVGVVTSAKKITYTAGSAMIAIQQVRRANGGEGQVGAELSNTEPESLALIAPEATTEYRVDPAAKTDYETLDGLCKTFKEFKGTFEEYKTSLMNNWLAGAGREQAQSTFNQFDEKVEEYYGFLEGARSNLETAVSNVSSLQ